MSLTLQLILSVVSKLPKPIRNAITPDMRIPPIANPPSKVQLARPAHIYVDHPDLDEFAKFAADFGFIEEARTEETIYFRGYGKDPYVYVACKSKDGKPRFRGAAFVAVSREDFDKAAKLEGARLGSIEYTPGGGEIITFNRPDETYFHVVFGQKERKPDSHEPTATHEEQGPFNKPFEKPRRGEQIRPTLALTGASALTRLAQGNSNGTIPALHLSTSWAITDMSFPISTTSWRGIPATSTSYRPTSSTTGTLTTSTS